MSKQNAKKFFLANVHPNVMEVFRVCRLNKVLPIVRDVDEAIDSL
jgi:anti-anti-sigma regulatory factor